MQNFLWVKNPPKNTAKKYTKKPFVWCSSRICDYWWHAVKKKCHQKVFIYSQQFLSAIKLFFSATLKGANVWQSKQGWEEFSNWDEWAEVRPVGSTTSRFMRCFEIIWKDQIHRGCWCWCEYNLLTWSKCEGKERIDQWPKIQNMASHIRKRQRSAEQQFGTLNLLKGTVSTRSNVEIKELPCCESQTKLQ